MSSSFGGSYGRRRRSFVGRLVWLAVVGSLAVGSAAYGYQVGSSAKRARITTLESEVERLQARQLDLSDNLTRARQRSRSAERALAELRQRYAAEVPDGEIAALLDRVERQLESGTDVDRLALFIDAAGRERTCEDAPETKRFMVRTPIGQAAASAVRFDDRVTVTGQGEPAENAQGLAEAWFDPAKPVRVEFRTLDGEVTRVDGTLPLHHRMLVGAREYRFAIIAGEQAFVEITAQACDAPVPRPEDGTPPPDPA